MTLAEAEILAEKRGYRHREDYKGNRKGSYIEAGKTYWDYSGGATPGNERLVSQIQIKAQKRDKYLSRSEIKRFLKSEDSQRLYNRLKKVADTRFGRDEDNALWRAYVYGGLATASANILAKKKKGGMNYLL